MYAVRSFGRACRWHDPAWSVMLFVLNVVPMLPAFYVINYKCGSYCTGFPGDMRRVSRGLCVYLASADRQRFVRHVCHMVSLVGDHTT
jgi:hypothetical protein